MPMTEASQSAGAPWEWPMRGTLDTYVVDSEVLASNPLGDSPRHPLYVYRPPGIEARGSTDAPAVCDLPAVYMIQGYMGQLDGWLAHDPFEPNLIERLDAMFAAGGCPDAVIVFVDAWTSIGGSQFINSAGTGRYLDYLCDEVVPFVDGRYCTAADRDRRGIAGKSSGGYGAMVVPMLRPDTFGALASHAGDALFELCYLPEFPVAVRSLRDRFEGSIEVFLRELRAADHFDFGRFGPLLNLYAMAAAYSPDPDRPGGVILPVELPTGRLRPDVWERWLQHDPVRMAPRHADALRSMRRIYLDAGRSDEYFLDLGAQAFDAELTMLGVDHTLALFDGGHGGLGYRYPGAIRELVRALDGSATAAA